MDRARSCRLIAALLLVLVSCTRALSQPSMIHEINGVPIHVREDFMYLGLTPDIFGMKIKGLNNPNRLVFGNPWRFHLFVRVDRDSLVREFLFIIDKRSQLAHIYIAMPGEPVEFLGLRFNEAFAETDADQNEHLANYLATKGLLLDYQGRLHNLLMSYRVSNAQAYTIRYGMPASSLPPESREGEAEHEFLRQSLRSVLMKGTIKNPTP